MVNILARTGGTKKLIIFLNARVSSGTQGAEYRGVQGAKTWSKKSWNGIQFVSLFQTKSYCWNNFARSLNLTRNWIDKPL